VCYGQVPPLLASPRSRFTDTVVSCHGGPDHQFAYNSFQLEDTLVTRWNLVCDQEYKVATCHSVYMAGLLVGSFISGWLGDKIGRRKTLLASAVLSSSFSLLGAFMPEYVSYTFTRFLTAVGAHGCFQMVFTISVEIVGNRQPVPVVPWVSYQTLLGILIQAPFAIGMGLISLVAMVIPYWFTLQWTMSLVTFLQVGLWFTVPESPRWLRANNRDEEYKALVMAAAKKNGKSLTFTNSKEEVETKKEPGILGIKDLFSRDLLLTTIVMFLSWPIVKVPYSGINLGLARLSDNLFIDFIAGSLIGEGGGVTPQRCRPTSWCSPSWTSWDAGLSSQVVFSSLASHALSVAS